MRRAGLRRTRARALAALPDAVEVVIVGVRSGLSPTAAVLGAAEHAAPELAPAFADVAHRLHRGARLADALGALSEHLGPAATGFVDTLSTADRYGLPLGPVLDRLATDVRTERRRQAERDARTLPVRLSFPLVVCTLPAFVLMAIAPAVLGAISTLRDSAL